jgi:AcrR family transcriptional regulator
VVGDAGTGPAAAPVSDWGHEPSAAGAGAAGPPGPPTDPRVARTQAHVLEHTRRLLVEQGPAGVTFSVLAAEARVSRQTLYRYWSGPEALVADPVSRRVAVPAGPPADVRGALVAFLRGLRTVFADPATSVAYGILMAAAHHSEPAATALASITAARLDHLNGTLARGVRRADRPDGRRLPLTRCLHGHSGCHRW